MLYSTQTKRDYLLILSVINLPFSFFIFIYAVKLLPTVFWKVFYSAMTILHSSFFSQSEKKRILTHFFYALSKCIWNVLGWLAIVYFWCFLFLKIIAAANQAGYPTSKNSTRCARLSKIQYWSVGVFSLTAAVLHFYSVAAAVTRSPPQPICKASVFTAWRSTMQQISTEQIEGYRKSEHLVSFRIKHSVFHLTS